MAQEVCPGKMRGLSGTLSLTNPQDHSALSGEW